MTEERENRRGNTVLLTVIAVATLLVAVIGATFAYFSVTVNQTGDQESVIVKTAELAISYQTGNTILANNITPGWKTEAGSTDREPKVFTVTNSGQVDVVFNIYWDDVNTGITKTFANDELVYTIEGALTTGNASGDPKSNLTPTAVPTANGTPILENIPLKAGATHTYTLNMEFINDLTSDQDYNQGVGFSGRIVVDTESVGQ